MLLIPYAYSQPVGIIRHRYFRGNGTRFTDYIIATKTVGVEAHGCEQLKYNTVIAVR